MRVIREPKVYVISSTAFNPMRMHQFLSDEKLVPTSGVTIAPYWLDPERVVEMAGRVCYMSYGKGRKTNEEFIKNLIDSGHHSVLEHANWSLLITGISRSLSHEFVRHRHFSYSQLSQRYVDSSDVAFIIPEAIDANDALRKDWEYVMGCALDNYKAYEQTLARSAEDQTLPQTLKTKLARQAARSVLPNATETKMVVTGNARAWREFFDKRGTVHAEPEIRRLAVKILKALKLEAPVLFYDYEAKGGLIERNQ